jgi:L-alanine-DL-glutamate epimerase-like enolase superfamily enzyme
MSISRKSFLKLSAGTAAFSMLQPGKAFSSFSYKDAPIIEKITVLRVPGEFYRSIAMNAYDKRPKGQAGTSRLARIVLSDGTYGLSVLGYTQFGGLDDKMKKGLKELIGTNPLKFYNWQGDTITGVADSYKSILSDVDYAFFETALLDVIGKIKQKPVWALFGESQREGIDAYDGTLYFKDVELETGP